MSSWEASSRPTWDPQGGAGENTQSFGVPDFSDDGGFPSSASPGTPPAIFQQDYDKIEAAQSSDFGQNGFGQNGFANNGLGNNGLANNDFGNNGLANNDFGNNGLANNDFGRDDFGRDDFGNNDFGQNGHGRQDRPGRQDHPGRGYRPEEDFRGNGQRRPSTQDYPQQQDPRQDYTRQVPARDYPGSDQAAPRDYRDPEQAARMDPALRDFFAPQPTRSQQARPDLTQQGYGQQRYGARGYPGQGGQPAQLGTPGANGRPPVGAPQGGQLDRWDNPAQRPGSRSAHRQDSRAGRGGPSTALIVVAVVVVLAAAVGGYLLTRHKPSAPAARTGPTTGPTQSVQPTKTASKTTNGGRTATTTARYTFTTPATAGGYAKLASVPTAVQTAAGAVSQAVKDAAVNNAGGKVTGSVTAAYELSGGQLLAFTGFTGTFSPAKVMASLASIGTDSSKEAAGPHGGMLSCAVAAGSGTESGTVCTWATSTTIGVAEFFGSNGPEVVSKQSKAAADAVKLRDSVEKSKS